MTHTLPPLNPMARAPRDGTRIVVMTPDGQTAGVSCQEGRWRGWIIGAGISGIWLDYADAELLGWWPMPALVPVEPESPWLLGETFPLLVGEHDLMRPLLEEGFMSREPFSVLEGSPNLLVVSCTERQDAKRGMVFTYYVRVVTERETGK